MKELNYIEIASNREYPKISLGMPVFNGENFIGKALDSILDQTYKNFELIIVDNASTDNTSQICRVYASKDHRIHYIRNKSNIGATQNHNKVFKLSKGEFFKWVAHDDVLAPDFLIKCISVLEKDPSIVLCHSNTGCIDEHGKLIGTYDYTEKINSIKPNQRLNALLEDRKNTWVLIFGLIRASSLRSTRLILNCIKADLILLAEISLIGRMYKIPECLFFRRTHPQAFSESMYQSGPRSSNRTLNWWTQNGRINFPTVKLFLEYFNSVGHVPLKLVERLLCIKQIIKWFLKVGWLLVFFDVGINLLGDSRLGHIFYEYSRATPNSLRSRMRARRNI
jgi:glycosyltransferase involved in cell wall biosynthesis